MKKTILRYGVYAALAEFLTFVLCWVVIYFFKPGPDVQGNIGYVAIISPLIFVYFGIRYYRDVFNNGSISFLKAIKIGLLIVLLPAVGYALIETTYVLIIDPGFYENIYSYEIAEYRKTLPPAEFAIKLKEIKQQLVLDKNPLFNFAMMVLIIGAFGIIVTLISALILQRKSNKIAVS
jgi:hypothetical protein